MVTAFFGLIGRDLRLAARGGIGSLVTVVFFVIAVSLFVYSIVSWLFFDSPQGWASLMAAVAFFGCVQMLMLGIFGEYLGRLYEQTKGRPLFVIDRIVRGDEQSDAAP